MKYDMCGGADVLGIMKILASNKVKANVYGIIPTTENLVSDKAYKCDDVITTLSKQTVEIVSTDAEGRLILCDALTYAQSLNVSHIIDIATLTGACVRALGDVYTGVFSNDDKFYNTFNEALKESDEKGWRLPIDDEYFKMLKSEVADFKNSAGKPLAGASVAANYLNAFINNSTKWIHLDVAGTADSNGKGATGAMIRTISYLLSKGSI
jgi:leucyl aminopeptidase